MRVLLASKVKVYNINDDSIHKLLNPRFQNTNKKMIKLSKF